LLVLLFVFYALLGRRSIGRKNELFAAAILNGRSLEYFMGIRFIFPGLLGYAPHSLEHHLYTDPCAVHI
jgi:hypothetical protein